MGGGLLSQVLARHAASAQQAKDTQAQFYLDAIRSGNLSPVPNPNNDPQVAAENEKRAAHLDYATQQLNKLYPDKNAKGAIQFVRGMIDRAHVHHTGQPPPPPGASSGPRNFPMTQQPSGARSMQGGPPPPPGMQTTTQVPPQPSPPPSQNTAIIAAAYPSPEAQDARVTAALRQKADIEATAKLREEQGRTFAPPKPSAPPKTTPPKVLTMNGIPYAVQRDGQILKPGDKDFGEDDRKTLDDARSAYAEGQTEKTRIANIHQSYFGSLPQGVLVKQDIPGKNLKAGELAFVSRQEAGQHPELYAPTGAGDQALMGNARFGEIQRTVDIVNDAIDKLPDAAWDATSRAQLAYVLRSTDPRSALGTFMTSEAAKGLTEAQVDYITALASMVESAQAMTSIQGIGQRGSDKLRATISAMLPTGATPTRAYAKRQMRLFQTELDQLKAGIPSLGVNTPGKYGAPPPPPGIRPTNDPLGLYQ